jgi:hypothetical protein
MGFLQIFQNRDISVKGMQVTDVFKSDRNITTVLTMNTGPLAQDQ